MTWREKNKKLPDFSPPCCFASRFLSIPTVSSELNLSEKTLIVWVARVGLNHYVLRCVTLARIYRKKLLWFGSHVLDSNSHLFHAVLLRVWAAGSFSNVGERCLTADDVHEFDHALRRCKNHIEIEIMVTLDCWRSFFDLSLQLLVGGWLSERASQEVGPLSCRRLWSRSRRRRFRPRRLVRRKRWRPIARPTSRVLKFNTNDSVT